jgi:molybdopterin-containing oxidoreductase family iron-sulfur binding subunit
VGFNAYLVRRAAAPWLDAGATLERTGKRHDLGITQEHWSMEGRPIVQEATGAQLQAKPDAFRHLRGGGVGTPPGAEVPPSLIPPVKYDGQQYAWGMAVDLSRCTGCNACVLACQAENNVPVVGKEGVQRTREMHWLRIDRYWSGSEHAPRTVLQPMLCQHCEAAPCEYVCPVNATVHSDEGLNDMVYNRCVGTRYCANNCPYKVRRFNFLHYTANREPTERMQANPDVTVRARGVMEKCTFCIQRIERARITARLEGRAVGEELVTACQQACPTRVFTFGNLHDPAQAVTRAHADARRYDVLADLGTRPRVAYLARLGNPSPQLPAAAETGDGHHG